MKERQDEGPDDWVLAPNIHHHPDIYERENEALLRDGRLDEALRTVCDWAGRDLLDVGCGTGFWLPIYAEDARRVVGVEPDPGLLEQAQRRVSSQANIEARRGSAEHLPLPEASVDVVHARFAYFFGEGAEAGLEEVRRVLRPGGVFVAIDNSWRGGAFAELLERATTGNGAIDPQATEAWWRAQGAERIEVPGGWRCETAEELEQILRIEFGQEVVDGFFATRPLRASLSYHFALYVIRRGG